MKRDLTKELREHIADILVLEPDAIRPERTMEELEVDSISFIRLVVLCETTYGLQFEDEMLLLSKFETIGDFMAYIQRRYELTSDAAGGGSSNEAEK